MNPQEPTVFIPRAYPREQLRECLRNLMAATDDRGRSMIKAAANLARGGYVRQAAAVLLDVARRVK